MVYLLAQCMPQLYGAGNAENLSAGCGGFFRLVLWQIGFSAKTPMLLARGFCVKAKRKPNYLPGTAGAVGAGKLTLSSTEDEVLRL